MMKLGLAALALGLSAVDTMANDPLDKLPKEITPAIRAACEADVRRMCIRKGSTQFTVKICVLANLDGLNTTCRKRLVQAGLISR